MVLDSFRDNSQIAHTTDKRWEPNRMNDYRPKRRDKQQIESVQW